MDVSAAADEKAARTPVKRVRATATAVRDADAMVTVEDWALTVLVMGTVAQRMGLL